ncbi:MAG: cob(I)yrinic acid a,c-diamide adenosyltransferase [Thermoplasmata archaeon]|nr:MAG: cob(I)yrinic acid a,c-diamide adenosyltransferase [Thermoplasmata archaeon]HEC89190.1 cob(I)yrinic acid a,c-diamide adenosyltransferase [Thermoplasmatales archaeon]
MTEESQRGFIHVYTGPGKGKTTAALGLALRATGANMKIHMVQFMKGRRYSEIDAIENIPNFTISQHGRDEFVSKENPEKIDIDLAREGFNYAKKIIEENRYDVVILDEINVAVDYNLIPLEDVIKLMQDKPEKLELVLTGRYAHPEIIKNADLVTEMLDIKHPFQKGILARKGIDY